MRAIGASNFSGARLKEALAIAARTGLPRYESLQPHYNLYDRAEYEQDLAALCVAEGIGVIPYYGLANGFLTGKYRSEADLGKSVRGGRIGPTLPRGGCASSRPSTRRPPRQGATPAQAALAWLAGRPAIAAPIASATSPEQVRDLVAAASLLLDSESRDSLDRAAA